MAHDYDIDAYVLAIRYALCPIVYGKYDADECATPPHHWMKLAKTTNTTNVLVKYDPAGFVE